MRPRADLRAITFDARGTLLRVRQPVGESYAAVARRHGASLSNETIEAAFLEVFPGMPPLAFPPMPEPELHRRENQWWMKLVRRVLRAAGERVDDFDAFFAELYARYRGAEAWTPYREAASVLCLLRSHHYKLGLVSNFDSRIEDVLIALNLSLWFDTITFSSRAGVAKPERGIFDRALAELEVEPHEALHIGDSLRKDYEGATAAGMEAILLDRDGRYADRDDIVRVDDIEGLLDHVPVGGFAAMMA